MQTIELKDKEICNVKDCTPQAASHPSKTVKSMRENAQMLDINTVGYEKVGWLSLI